MKKILLIIFITSILTSCWKNQLWMSIENTTNTNSGQNFQSKIKTENKEITNTGSENKELINTWSNEEKQKSIKTIKKDWFNLFLYENDKKIDSLTTHWNIKNFDNTPCDDDDDKEYIYYNIIWQDKDFWLVLKHFYKCWTDQWNESLFAINFNNSDVKLTNIDNNSTRTYNFNEYSYNNWILTISIQSNEVVEWEWDRFNVWSIELKDYWFINNWDKWVKTINLKNIIKPEIKKEEKVEAKKIDEPKLDSKYSDANLRKNWYKFNNLWNIKEYYKAIITDNKQENSPWSLIEYNTIYIKWNKILEIVWNNYYEWWTSWFEPTLKIFDWKENINISNLYDYDLFPIQPIFHKNYANKIFNREYPSKLIVDWDLNTIKIVDKENGINKTIWSR